MRWLPKFSVDHPVTMTMFIGIVVVMGFLSLSRLGQEMMPDVSYPTVTVLTQYEGASPEEVERLITEPIEEAVSMISGVERVYSVSSEGKSTVTVEFEWGSDVDAKAQDVREKLGLIEDFLPEDASQPIVFKFSTAQIPVYEFGMVSDSLSPLELKRLAEDEIKPRLERLEGVAAVEITGVDDKEVIVDVDVAKLRGLGLSLGDVIMTLRAQNLNLPAGQYRIGPTRYLLRAKGEVKDLQSLLETPIGFTKGGRPVRLGEVAQVHTGIRERKSLFYLDDQPGVLVIVLKQSKANAVKVADRVKAELAALKPLLPSNIRYEEVFDQSYLTKHMNRNTWNTAWQGGLLAIIVVFLFLVSWRPALTIAITIPLSVIATFIVMYWRGDTLNMTTLGGIMIAVGMLVDNAVVVVENIFRHMEEGKPRREAAIKGASEVGLAITASTVTNIIVFLPLIYAGGVVGQFMKSLAITVTTVLLASLFMALTVTPMIAGHTFKEGVRRTYWFEPVRRWYTRALEWVLSHRIITSLGVLGLLVLSIFTFSRLGGEFMPKTDMRYAVLQVEMPRGIPFSEAENYFRSVAKIIRQAPEVENISVMYGPVGLSSFFGGEDAGLFYMKLVEPEKRERTKTQLVEWALRTIPHYRGAIYKELDMRAQMMGGGRDIEIKIYGQDLKTLRALAERVKAEIEKLPGVANADISLKEANPELVVEVDKDLAAYRGLTAFHVEQELEALNKGRFATRIDVGGERLDVVVRGSERNPDLRNAWIKSPAGFFVPLTEVAKVKEGVGPVSIERENRTRMVAVSADNVSGSLLQKFRLIRKALAKVKFPQGYSWDIGGQMEQMMDMMKTMGWVILAAIIIIYMVLASLFESFRRPLYVMFTVPLAFMGASFAMFFAKVTISMISIMGLLILFGVVVNNAIVMIDLIDQLRKQGLPPYEALVKGASYRVRPVLITALTTMIGLLPSAILHTTGYEMRAPMSIALIGGLFTGTFITLFVIPMVYMTFEGIKKPQA